MRGWSYVDERLGVRARMREAAALLAGTQADAEATAETTLDTIRRMAARLEPEGVALEGLDVLDVGPGQMLRHMRCLSATNRVTGIDTDLIPQSFGDYAVLLRDGSAVRVAKTLARKALGRDRHFEAALAQALGLPRLGRQRVRRMDARSLAFDDASFDLVYSFSAFEHIPEPERAVAEVARVLRPGGAAHLSLHLYTSHSGQHDARLMFQPRPAAPLWPHLRPEHAHTVQPATFINGLRLDRWREIFREALPGVRFVRQQQEGLVEPLRVLRQAGELEGYDDDELLTVNFVAIWRKGATGPAPEAEAVEWVP